MRELNQYCSEEFKSLFGEYASEVRSLRSVEEYVSVVNMITSALSMDYLDIRDLDARYYFEKLEQDVIHERLSRKTFSMRVSCNNTIANFISGKKSGYINPFRNIRRLDVDHSIQTRNIPSVVEIDKIIGAASGDPMWFLILCLALRTCLTATQITRVRAQNIRTTEDGKVMLFFPKTSTQPKDLWITVPDDTKDILLSYLAHAPRDEQGHIFFNERKRPLSVRNINFGVRKYVDASGIKNKYSIKDLRSRGVLAMASAEVPPEEIGKYADLGPMRVGHFMEKKHLLDHENPQNMVALQLKHVEIKEKVIS